MSVYQPPSPCSSLVTVLCRLQPTVYCLLTFPLVTRHSSLHLGGKKPQAYKAGPRLLPPLAFGLFLEYHHSLRKNR